MKQQPKTALVEPTEFVTYRNLYWRNDGLALGKGVHLTLKQANNLLDSDKRVRVARLKITIKTEAV